MTNKKSNDHTDQNVPLLKSNTRLRGSRVLYQKPQKNQDIEVKQ